MKTYSVIVEVFNPFTFGSGSRMVATAKNGKLYRFEERDGRYFAVLFTCGSALLERAKRELEELQGDFIVETNSQYFPGHAEIIDTMAL